MANKLLVFLSHINEEADLALSVKALIEDAFLGLVDVFVSSDPDSIAYGQKWLNGVTASLRVCVVELILCSPDSIGRPWINFEAGAGWIRDIPVIPLCHSGLSRETLPIPLSLLQAANLSNPQDIKGALATIASTLGSKVPAVTLTSFIESVQQFEANYTFWSKFDSAFAFGTSYLNGSPVIQQFLAAQTFRINLTETAINELRQGLLFFLTKGLVNIERVGGSQ